MFVAGELLVCTGNAANWLISASASDAFWNFVFPERRKSGGRKGEIIISLRFGFQGKL